MAGDFNLGSAYVTLRTQGDIEKELRRQGVGLQNLARKLSDGTYKRMAQGVAALRAEHEKLMRQARWHDQVAQHGIVVASLNRMKDAVAGVGMQAKIAFGAGIASITGFVAAASPDAMNTLTRSFEYLAAVIGKAFVPYVGYAALYVQKLAKWIKGLSDEQKAWYAKIIVTGLALVGFVAILPQVIASITAMVVAVKALAGGLASLTPAGIAAIAVFTALAAAIAFVAYRMTSLQSSAAKYMDRIKQIQGGTATKDDFEEYQKIKKTVENDELMRNPLTGKAMSKEEKAKYLESWGDSLDRQAKERTDEFQKRTSFGKGTAALTGEAQKELDTILDMKRRAALYKKAGESIRTGKDTLKLAPGEGGDLMIAGAGAQPQYQQIEDVRKTMQLAALEEDPMKKEMLQIAQESLDALMSIKDSSTKIAEKPTGLR